MIGFVYIVAALVWLLAMLKLGEVMGDETDNPWIALGSYFMTICLGIGGGIGFAMLAFSAWNHV